MMFASLVRKYRHRYLIGEFLSAAVRWLPAGSAAGIVLYLLFRRWGLPLWPVLPALALPPFVAGVPVLFRHWKPGSALSWLDNRIGGRQELQAALEVQNSGGLLEPAIVAAGTAILEGLQPRPPRPTASPASSITAVLSLAAWVLVLVAGSGFLAPPDDDVVLRGEVLEAWAESWAEENDADAESRELAGRMGRLGRRMADGSLGTQRSERALRQLEEDIATRQDDLIRDKVAESLVDDLNLDRQQAESFRVGTKRLPADLLSDLGDAVADSTILSSSDRELLERLLSDPEMRDESGRGRPELTEELTRALDDALETDDPLRDRLEQATKESRRARALEDGEDRREGPETDTAAESSGRSGDPATPGESSGQGGQGAGDDEGSSPETGRSGGTGRGDAPIRDEATGSLPPLAADTTENPMRLPSGNDGSRSWKTVVRAYGEAGETAPSLDAEGLPPWERDLEAVISRDDIPPGVRDYVREYFLALEGGAPEATENESGAPAPQPHTGTTQEE